MKKFALIIAGVMATGMAQAATTLVDSGNLTKNNATLLNEDVTINLSANVVAGIAYDNTQIVIATCHEAGRTVERSADVISTDNNGVQTTTTTVVTGAEMPTATTLQGTVIKMYPGSTCDVVGTNVTTHASGEL